MTGVYNYMMLKYLKQSLVSIICFVSIIIIVKLMLIASTALNKMYHEIVYLNVLLLITALVFGLAGFFRFKARFHRLKLALRQGVLIPCCRRTGTSSPK